MFCFFCKSQAPKTINRFALKPLVFPIAVGATSKGLGLAGEVHSDPLRVRCPCSCGGPAKSSLAYQAAGQGLVEGFGGSETSWKDNMLAAICFTINI